MSLYPPPQAFPPMGYPNPTYAQRPPPPPLGAYGYPTAPAGPSQPVYYDPNTFRRDYASRLGELSINSRPVIQSLSMMAQEHTRWAEIVAQCIEAHIRRVSHVYDINMFGRPGLAVGSCATYHVYIVRQMQRSLHGRCLWGRGIVL